jgi:cytochrome c oxidase assembly factor CtaG
MFRNPLAFFSYAVPGRTSSKRLRRQEIFAVLALIALGWPQFLHGHGADPVTATQGWVWRWDVIVTLILAAVTYARGWWFLRRSASRAASFWRLGLYGIGLASLVVALLSPVDGLASERLSMHMVQHLLLLMVAPLAILLANPFGAFLWGLPDPLRKRFAALFHRGAHFRTIAWFLTFMPVAWGLYVLNLWGWHHPAIYQAALVNPWMHDLEHLLFFSTALLFWWPIANVPPLLHGQISLGLRIIYLVAATLQNTLLGMAISLPERVLYPFYQVVPALQGLSPIHDQALGGGIMWVSGHMYLIPIVVLIARRLIAEDEAGDRSYSTQPMNRVRSAPLEGNKSA